MNFRKSAAIGAAAFAVAACSFAFAQDDLDDLLKDLESESKAETPAAVQPAAETPAVETPAPAAAEVAETPAEEPSPAPATEEPAPVVAAEEPAPAPAAVADEPTPAPAEPAPAVAKSTAETPDAELVENIVTTERLRRKAFDAQAKREIDAARACLRNKEYEECAEHYTEANKLLNDSPEFGKKYRRECLQGVAEATYRAAKREWAYGDRQKAIEQMQKAMDMRHPKARRELEDMLAKEKTAEVKDFADVAHVRNEQSYQKKREANRKHLRRARQLLAVRDIDGALDECGYVLATGNDPFNEEAIRLRAAIQKKRGAIYDHEREVMRDSMIAEVSGAWRPVYAPSASKIETAAAATRKTPLSGEDPERTVEQDIIKRMKEIRLPSISIKPPATLDEVIATFNSQAKDLDRPDIPLERRGFNIMVMPKEGASATAVAASDGDGGGFGAESGDEDQASQTGIAIRGMITANDISVYDALTLVCESVNYTFKVKGSIVMVMDKNTPIEEMVTRSYPVLSSFMDRMEIATSSMEEMESNGFRSSSSKRDGEGSDDNSQERKWKKLFGMLGVQWPNGSSLIYIKAVGKLRVRNTYENLAVLEEALTEMNVDPRLIEIEARFVEVEQEDLNSLGFEWILNSDYAIGMDNWLGKALNMQGGKFSGSETETQTLTGYKTVTTTDGGTTTQVVTPQYQTTTSYASTQGASWIKDVAKNASMGLNAFGGTSEYGQGQRYLSTVGNHISGEGESTNDQFMRVNAFLGNADLSMILHMLSQRSDTDLLNAPKVLTKSGEKATIKVVTEYIYPTDYNVQLQSSSSSSYNGGGQSAVLAVVEPEQFTMREVGVILEVEPQLTDEGSLIELALNTSVVDEPSWKNYGMKIPFSGNSSITSFEGLGEIFDSLSSVIESVGGTIPAEAREQIIAGATSSAMNAMDSLTSTGNKNIEYYEAPMEQPFFHVRSIDSKVSVYPGATIVMGGLIREERKAMDDKIPFLGDLPFAGRFFRSHAEKTTKRNLLIFLTTRLVDARGRELPTNSAKESEADVKAAPEPKAE